LGRGCSFLNSAENAIGSGAIGSRNIIAANEGSGIVVSGSSSVGNEIAGNCIGTDDAGVVELGNLEHGIRIENAGDNLIGGFSAEGSNKIAFNGGDGLFDESGLGNSFFANQIY